MKDWQELSVAERIKLAQDIWDSVAEDPSAVPITEAERAYLDAQLEAYDANPTGVPWTEVRAKVALERDTRSRPARVGDIVEFRQRG